ncbi:MAG: hypothetical protein ACKVP5_08640 [Aestuariivirga sp.]
MTTKLIVLKDGDVVEGDEKRLSDLQLLEFIKDVTKVLGIMASERSLKAVAPSLKACAMAADHSLKRREKFRLTRAERLEIARQFVQLVAEGDGRPLELSTRTEP